MIISISNPVLETGIFSIVLGLVLLVSIRPRQIKDWLPPSLTAELKGLAILMIVLSHIGYFLVSDTRFLWPLSIMAGVGVNLFLFLSGFGLTASQIQKDLSVWQFYKRRLWKLFVPFWLMLAGFLALDFLLLKISYSWSFIWPAIIGIFSRADLYHDLNSPLWYFTFILLYYLLFPLVFFRRRPWLSALILYLAGWALVNWPPSFFDYVIHLYKVHIMAFPLGVLVAWIVSKVKQPNFLEEGVGRRIGRYVAIGLLGLVFLWANINSGIGGSANWEQNASILAVIAITGVFILKKIELKSLTLLGLYSYEIYLWHWPLMYRYDLLYRYLPPWLATFAYLIVLIALGWLMAKIADFLFSRFPARQK